LYALVANTKVLFVRCVLFQLRRAAALVGAFSVFKVRIESNAMIFGQADAIVAPLRETTALRRRCGRTAA